MTGHIRVPVDIREATVSTGGHKWRRGWEVTLGTLSVRDTSKTRAADRLGEVVGQFMADLESPRVIVYGDRMVVLSVKPGVEGPSYGYDTYDLGGNRKGSTGFGAVTMRELVCSARGHLVQMSTDFLDDESVHRGAAFLADDEQRHEHYRYAAWQRAAKHAIDTGEADFHRWAGEHSKDEQFQVTPQQKVA